MPTELLAEELPTLEELNFYRDKKVNDLKHQIFQQRVMMLVLLGTIFLLCVVFGSDRGEKIDMNSLTIVGYRIWPAFTDFFDFIKEIFQKMMFNLAASIVLR